MAVGSSVRASTSTSWWLTNFTAANGLRPKQAEPLLSCAISYLALNKIKEAGADLDEAAQDDPQNVHIWTSRGLAYERLGDKAKAAKSTTRAINLHPKDETARTGFAKSPADPDRLPRRRSGLPRSTAWKTDFAASSISSATLGCSRLGDCAASARRSSGPAEPKPPGSRRAELADSSCRSRPLSVKSRLQAWKP